MPDPVVELSKQAQTLLPEQRARLAELLLDSIHQSPDLAVEQAWDQELQKRIAEIDQGTAVLIPADEVFSQVRRSIQ